MEENDYGHSRTQTSKLIEGIKTDIKVSEVKARGGSMRDVADTIMGGEENIRQMGRMVITTLSMKSLADLAGVDITTTAVMDGYAYIVKGYVDHPLAVEFGNFIDDIESKTINDVLVFMLSKEKNSPTVDQFLNSIDGLEFEWFVAEILHLPATDFRKVAKTKEQSELNITRHNESVARVNSPEVERLMNLPHDEAVQKFKERNEKNG